MRTRQLHFIHWCLKAKLPDPTFAKYELKQRNFLMACYAISLTTNQSIYCKTVKASTVSTYLSDAAKLSILNKLHDPTKNAFNQRSHFITNVLSEHKRWESMPNRREPLTYKMIHKAQLDLAKSSSPIDSLPQVLFDWMVLGIVTGVRKSEWCQSRQSTPHGGFQQNIDGTSKAFILDDFTFEDSQGMRITNDPSHDISDASTVTIRWRFQKNGDNGQKLSYTANKRHPSLCPVQAAMRIRNRAIRLGLSPEFPIAVFLSTQGTITYCDDGHVEQHLRYLATECYNISNEEDLSRFTCHSFRVGACVLLHEANEAPDFIKFRLRWKSDSYLMYLRNTPKLASKHNLATDAAMASLS